MKITFESGNIDIENGNIEIDLSDDFKGLDLSDKKFLDTLTKVTNDDGQREFVVKIGPTCYLTLRMPQPVGDQLAGQALNIAHQDGN